MRNILLILENQLEFDLTKTVLQKLGFNVLWIQKGDNTREKLSKNFPDLVITSVLGSDDEFLSEFVQIRQKRGTPKFIWVGAVSRLDKLKTTQRQLIDTSLPTPIQPDLLIQSVCRLFQLNESEYLQKYRALLMSGSTGTGTAVKPMSSPQVTPLPRNSEDPFKDSTRAEKYKDVVANIPMQDKVFAPQELSKRTQENPGGNTSDLLEKKRAFVKALIKTKI